MAQLSVNRIRDVLSSRTKHTKGIIARQSTERLYLVGALLLFAALAFGAIITALGNALYFDGPAQDGAFQLLNPLRRLMAGQVIGRDFNFFHGIGVPLLHLPFYAIFGQGLFGEEMARWLVSPLLFVLSTFTVFYIWRRRFVFALCMSAAVTGIGMLVVPFLVLPITSILGVRSVMPVFLLAVILNQQRLSRPVLRQRSEGVLALTWYELIVGSLLAASLMCGTEFGAAAILAFSIARIVLPIRKGERFSTRWLSLLRTGISGGVVLFVALTIITRGNPIEPIRYALVDIPADQFWYFGVPPNKYINSDNVWQTFANDWLLLIMWVMAVVAAWLGYRLFRLGTFRIESQAFLYAWLTGTFAMVSMLGYYSNFEASNLARMSLIMGSIAIVILGERWKRTITYGYELGKSKKRFKLQPAMFWRGLAIFIIMLSLVYAALLAVFLKDKFPVGEAFVRVKNYVTGVDTNVLGGEWRGVDQLVMPIIQADNTVAIADTNADGYEHGVKAGGNQLVVESGAHDSFIRPGQIVYFPKAGRQIVRSVTTRDHKLYVTLQGSAAQLDPAHDGAPQPLVVAEDFKHDNTKVWSLYTGVINQEMGIMNPSRGGYDYIIHALGQQRRADYLNDFKTMKPKFVMTFTHDYFAWEGWMENEHWSLYSLIDQNYEVVRETPTYAVWKRKDQAWSDQHAQAQVWQPLTVDAADQKITLPKSSFDNAPDVEAYGQKVMQQDRQRLLDFGRVVPTQLEISLDQYDQYVVQNFNSDLVREEFNRENNGPEADATQKKVDDARRAQELREYKQAKSQGLSGTGPQLHTPRPKRLVMLVNVHYKLSSSISAIPLFGKTVRFMIESNNTYSSTAVSLNPNVGEMTFPVVISEYNQDPYLRLKTYSLLPATGTIQITSASWTMLDTSAANLKTLAD